MALDIQGARERQRLPVPVPSNAADGLHPAIYLTIAALALLFAGSVLAQGGPPFRSNNPGTPGKRHWEINTAGIGERNPVQGTYSLPNFDINYGLGDRTQMKYE